MATLLESARMELATAHPEQYKIFLLGAMTGLRRNDIDKLPWSAFRWNEGVIRIQATEFFRPKSHDSEGDVLVDPELLEIFRGHYARRKSDFVVESASSRTLPHFMTITGASAIFRIYSSGCAQKVSFQGRRCTRCAKRTAVRSMRATA
jgi:hypothetical protein